MTSIDLNRWESRFQDYLLQHFNHDDGAHGLDHFRRVWRVAQAINAEEGQNADELVVLTAAYFHDLVSLPKNHADRHTSSWLSAERTAEILTNEFPDFPGDKIEAVKHAIHAHSFSANITPQTIEAKILQDADRMEALGAIGMARVFYVSGQLGTQLFEPNDPLAQRRELNDRLYALDHFELKLFKLPALMNTAAGKRMAERKVDFLREFVNEISKEALGEF